MIRQGSFIQEEPKKITNCECCNKKYYFFSARHTCKKCLKVVCKGCSQQSVIFPKYGNNDLIKVCCVCALEMKNKRKYGVNKYWV